MSAGASNIWQDVTAAQIAIPCPAGEPERLVDGASSIACRASPLVAVWQGLAQPSDTVVNRIYEGNGVVLAQGDNKSS